MKIARLRRPRQFPDTPAPLPPVASLPNSDAAPCQPSPIDDATLKSLNAKIADNPDDAGALYRRGQVYASKGIYNLAIKDFDDTIRLNPKDVEAYNNRCWTRTVTGELQPLLRQYA